MPFTGQLKLLLVDDDEADREAVRHELLRVAPQLEIGHADTCATALQSLSDGDYDCAIVDNGLPDGDAISLIKEVRDAGCRIPIIVRTGRGDESLAVRLLKAGAADYLTKGKVNGVQILKAVRRARRIQISEEKANLAEEALRASRESLATTLRCIADAVVTVDQKGTVTFANPAAESMFEQDAAQMTGQPLSTMARLSDSDGMPVGEAGLLAHLVARAVSGTRRELTLVRSNGSKINVEERVSLLMGQDRSTPSGAVITLTDTTERHREQLRQAFLVDLAPALAASLGFDRALSMAVDVVTPRVARGCLLGVAPINGGPVRWTRTHDFEDALFDQLEQSADFAPSDESHPLVRAQLHEGLEDAEATASLLLLDAKGLVIQRRYFLLPFRARRLQGLVLMTGTESTDLMDDPDFAQDFTRRIALALDNAWLVGELEQAVRVRDDILAVVSHDLRSPLSTLALTAEALLEEFEDSSNVGLYTAAISRAVERMDRLIQDLLDADSMSSGKLTVYTQLADLGQVCAGVTEMFRAQVLERGLSLDVEIEQGLPAVHIDPHRIAQVVANLLGNAVKFTATGGVGLQVGLGGDRTVRVAVSDSGPGIPAELQAKIFERFYRADRNAPGAGLGLAIASGIVEAHGSRLQLDSVVGRGSVFFFTLPLPSL